MIGKLERTQRARRVRAHSEHAGQPRAESAPHAPPAPHPTKGMKHCRSWTSGQGSPQRNTCADHYTVPAGKAGRLACILEFLPHAQEPRDDFPGTAVPPQGLAHFLEHEIDCRDITFSPILKAAVFTTIYFS